MEIPGIKFIIAKNLYVDLLKPNIGTSEPCRNKENVWTRRVSF